MAKLFSYDAWDDDLAVVRAAEDDSAHTAMFYPGERIGPPLPSRSLIALKRLLSIGALIAAVWGCWETREAWQPIVESVQRHIRPTDHQTPAQPEEPVATIASPLQPLAAGKYVAEVAGSANNPLGSPAASATSAKAFDADAATQPKENSNIVTPEQPEKLAPLPAPQVDAKDRKQKRAAAIGLHPGVSPVLLSSLSDADYRNAALAIRKALAETADNDKFIWPRDSKPKLARFQVHFVPSAGPDCRRYVVTVVKNGWTTTTPPMEKCGIPKPNRRAVTALPARKQTPITSIE